MQTRLLGSLLGLLLPSLSATANISSSPLGYWSTKCTVVQKDHAIVHITFSETNLLAVTEMYEDAECKSLGMKISYTGTYALGTPLGQAYGIDFMATAVTLLITGDASVLAANKKSLCGINDWAPGIAREVSNRFCEPFRTPRLAQKVTDIFSIRDNVMWFGAFPRLPKRNDSRPTALSAEFRYKKTS